MIILGVTISDDGQGGIMVSNFGHTVKEKPATKEEAELANEFAAAIFIVMQRHDKSLTDDQFQTQMRRSK